MAGFSGQAAQVSQGALGSQGTLELVDEDIGLDALGRVLTVVYTYRPPEAVRLIAARPATSREKQAYEA